MSCPDPLCIVCGIVSSARYRCTSCANFVFLEGQMTWDPTVYDHVHQARDPRWLQRLIEIHAGKHANAKQLVTMRWEP